VLRRSFDQWGIFDYVLNKKILLTEKKLNGSKRDREVYLTSRDSFKMISDNVSLSHTGMLVGHLKRRSFVPSMAGADLIARVSVKFPFVRVSHTAEALVLYGRDIMYGSIIDYGNLSGNNTILIILNEYRVPIGLGITTVSIEKNIRASDKRIVIKTLVDAGHYLRNERLSEGNKIYLQGMGRIR
jgi:ribosome biogenesis protein Nip4